MTPAYRARKTGTEIICPRCGHKARLRSDRKSDLYFCFACSFQMRLGIYSNLPIVEGGLGI